MGEDAVEVPDTFKMKVVQNPNSKPVVSAFAGPNVRNMNVSKSFQLPGEEPTPGYSGWPHSMATVIGLDFETWGSRSLPKVGLDNYLADPSFRVLIAHVAWKVVGEVAQSKGFDFVVDGRSSGTMDDFRMEIAGASSIVAFNVMFEKRVLARMGIDTRHIVWVDAAMIARAMGAGGSLEAAAPQLLGTAKLASGKRLIQKFSVPNEQFSNRPPTRAGVDGDPDWDEYNKYCGVDAELAIQLAFQYAPHLLAKEYDYEKLTLAMNEVGWTVDLKSLARMQLRYERNKELALAQFQEKYDPQGELNLNSLKQLKEWCLVRGVRAKSFDEEHVEDMLTKVEDRLTGLLKLTAINRVELLQVRDLLRTKQVLGGSSLKKLDVIERVTGEDGQLRDQYMHIGAGQSYRTTGRGVQMQNLKRLHNQRDMSELADPDPWGSWSNSHLAENMRQLFTASAPTGSLIVGDFSSVESRGLAYLAGEDWKTRSYRQGRDLYKELAAGIFRVAYADVTKEQRQTGKVGELSCGYGAGGAAVKSFASKMGVEFTDASAAKLVRDWRDINPTIVDLWSRLGEKFLEVVQAPGTGAGSYGGAVTLAHGMSVEFTVTTTPSSLTKQHPGVKSIVMTLIAGGRPYLQRYFHGCYMRGRDICYYKPSDRVGGDLWSNKFTDPKTKQTKFHKIYGGKIAGILTQSFCREIFFHVMHNVYRWTSRTEGATLIGQFHDEIVVDYVPTEDGRPSLEDTKSVLAHLMTETQGLPFSGFPLGAEVQSDYRYIK